MSLLERETKAEEREKSAWNERAKLTATYINGVAVALIAVGGFSPAFAPKPAQIAAAPSTLTYLSVGVCFGVSIALHLVARSILRSLR